MLLYIPFGSTMVCVRFEISGGMSVVYLNPKMMVWLLWDSKLLLWKIDVYSWGVLHFLLFWSGKSKREKRFRICGWLVAAAIIGVSVQSFWPPPMIAINAAINTAIFRVFSDTGQKPLYPWCWMKRSLGKRKTNGPIKIRHMDLYQRTLKRTKLGLCRKWNNRTLFFKNYKRDLVIKKNIWKGNKINGIENTKLKRKLDKGK